LPTLQGLVQRLKLGELLPHQGQLSRCPDGEIFPAYSSGPADLLLQLGDGCSALSCLPGDLRE
jgi:hypothetical protein